MLSFQGHNDTLPVQESNRESVTLRSRARRSDHVPPFSRINCNPLHCFPLHSRLHRQQYSPTTVCFKQTILPPLLISKYGLMVLSPPFLVPVVLECMSHAPNATHPIPCPSLLVQLPPASQLKPLPSSKVSIGVLAIS